MFYASLLKNDGDEKKEDGGEGEGGFNEGESGARLSSEVNSQRYREAKVERRIPQNSGKPSSSSASIYQYSEPQTVSTTSTGAGTCLSTNGKGVTDVLGPPVGRGEDTMGRRKAAVSVQAWVRGVICRRRVSEYRIRRQAAITIQSTWLISHHPSWCLFFLGEPFLRLFSMIFLAKDSS